ncbi:MAG: hypothetical protein WAV76_10225 [Bacteroidota bacterium]
MEEIIYDNSKSRGSQTAILLALTFIVGLFIGLILHNSFVQPPTDQSDIKSWYPR